ncbi:hypothetical protein SERLADRAFT_441776 [Serpula lacrymans var. lacrymans S7.9]|uniref:F-box domain-containing protein n=1 Tax=Serpula lacrymans var. lacrymans (strain S7.9) TaxID=578457 RepID=F8P7L5_SERL9|nr:uncharacterized protein SERLADRAFT_441776 [Serpula lacrymans var. lacrymans S7.9]EGO21425.1 hypothetical protein SERLADRAFT_441776 [Serpula lacrymans var. lacrymans S7.9]
MSTSALLSPEKVALLRILTIGDLRFKPFSCRHFNPTTTYTMHRCLRLTEILTLIFSFKYATSYSELEPPVFQEIKERDDALHKRTLASLARTCKLFSGPALDALWGELDDFAPLVRCMSSNLWYVDGEKMTLRRPVEASDWLILRKYATRVRVVVLSVHLSARFNNELLGVFSTLCPYPLLPALKELHCIADQNWNIALPFLRSLVNPGITSLSLPFPILDGVFGISVLASLSEMCPLVQRFHMVDSDNMTLMESLITFPQLRRFVWSSRACSTMTNLACSWKHLQSIEFCMLDEQAILRLADLPSLKEIGLAIMSPISHSNKLSVPHPVFRSLTALHITAYDLSGPISLLEMVRSPLEEISVLLPRIPSPDALHSFYTTLSQHASPDHLKSVVVSVIDRRENFELANASAVNPQMSGISYATIDIEMVRDLLHFRRIERFTVGGDFDNFLWNDDTLQELALAWPNLHILQLGDGTGPPWTTPSRVSLRGLTTLLKLCPQLEHLTIVIDAGVVPSVQELGEDVVCNKLIESLTLLNSNVGDSSAVATFLYAILPRLVHIRPHSHLKSLRWIEVSDYLLGYALERETRSGKLESMQRLSELQRIVYRQTEFERTLDPSIVENRSNWLFSIQ